MAPKHKTGAQLVLVVVDGADDAGMLDALQDLELSEGGPCQHLPRLGGLGRDRVASDAAHKARERDVPGLPVLIPGTVEQQSHEFVVGDALLPFRGADARVLHRPAQRPSDHDVDFSAATTTVAESRWRRRGRVRLRAFARRQWPITRQSGDDSGAPRAIAMGFGVTDVGALASG
jgi:hypothetical protein